jgi:ribonuclease HII
MPPRLFSYDQKWRDKGYQVLAGADEAGIGPWAGPVVAAAVVLKPETRFKDLNDSKQLTPEKRENLFDLIQKEAVCFGVAVVDHLVVDEINVLQATFLAVKRAVEQLSTIPHLVLYDGNKRLPRFSLPQETVIKGDGMSACIAAASVLAKVTRDRLMEEAHAMFPHYGFNEHKGYGTPSHQEALRRHGPCPIHRRSYTPILDLLTPSLPLVFEN